MPEADADYSFKVEMPEIPLNDLINKLSANELDLVQCICRKGKLKANPPTIKFDYVVLGPITVKRPVSPTGEAAYLWGLVAYDVSPYKKHLALRPDYRRFLTDISLATRLEEIANYIIEAIPDAKHYGKITRGELR